MKYKFTLEEKTTRSNLYEIEAKNIESALEIYNNIDDYHAEDAVIENRYILTVKNEFGQVVYDEVE